jgi:hypothetical protein
LTDLFPQIAILRKSRDRELTPYVYNPPVIMQCFSNGSRLGFVAHKLHEIRHNMPGCTTTNLAIIPEGYLISIADDAFCCSTKQLLRLFRNLPAPSSAESCVHQLEVVKT